jgi:predicted DNA-binding ribbon-helix-helix protein
MSKTKLIEVEIDISDELFMSLAKIAHKRDITLNQLCVEIIDEHISKEMKGNEGN